MKTLRCPLRFAFWLWCFSFFHHLDDDGTFSQFAKLIFLALALLITVSKLTAKSFRVLLPARSLLTSTGDEVNHLFTRRQGVVSPWVFLNHSYTRPRVARFRHPRHMCSFHHLEDCRWRHNFAFVRLRWLSLWY